MPDPVNHSASFPEGQQIDLVQAKTFLDCIGQGESFTFQTFGEASKQPRLNSVKHGSLDQHHEALERLNSSGAAVCVMVNAGNATGKRSNKNVQRARAAFVDLDGSPLEPVTQAILAPHLTVESSPGKYHAYWRIEGLPLEQFSTVQLALAQRFNGDPSVKDLSRVMRLPGFLHQKGTPFRTRILRTQDMPPHPAGELLDAFAIDPSAIFQVYQKHGRIPGGARNDSLYQMAVSLLSKGLLPDAVLLRLITKNAKDCSPPLPNEELKSIWQSACKHRPSNNLLVELFGDPALTKLSFPARWLYGIARTRAASSSGPFSLTLADCESMGYGRKQRQHALQTLIAAGLIVEKRPYIGGKEGEKKRCALYSLGVISTPKCENFRGQKFHSINGSREEVLKEEIIQEIAR